MHQVKEKLNHEKYGIIVIIAVSFFIAGLFVSSAFAKQKQEAGYLLEHENDIAKNEPAPHNGGGNTTVYNFFNEAVNSKLVFRKRVLHPGAAIGYHLQKTEEIYYILSGKGEMTMNNEIFEVNSGDVILTLAGSSHGLKQAGAEDRIVIIDYEKSNE
ncbi:MAG: cupin domain-containing protein [Parafilimonas sp.]